MLALLWPFLIYALILYVAIYVITDQAQDYLYGEPTPGMPVKVAIGTVILAAMLTWTRTSFQTMFTDDIGKTTLQALAWTGVFILLLRFQPWHGFGIALGSMLIVTTLASMAVDSLLTPRPAASTESPTINKPLRRPMGPTTPPPAPAPAATK